MRFDLEWLFGWGIERMNRLGYRNKFALVSFLFLLPLGIALGAVHTEWSAQLAFSRQEALAIPVLHAWGDAFAELLRLDVQPVERRDPERLRRAEQHAARLTARSFPQHAGFQPQRGSGGDARAIREAIQAVGDSSNLILDPDLDSYYLMETVVLRIPEAFTLLDEIAALELGASPGDDHARFRAMQLVALLHVNLAAQERALRVARRSSAALSPELTRALSSYGAELSMLTRVLEGSATIGLGDRAPLTAAIATTAEAGSAYRMLATGDLERLLMRRIDAIEYRQLAVSLSALLALLAVTYAWIAFYLAVRRTVRALARTPDELRGASVKELTELAIGVRDELGQVAHAFIGAVLVLREEHDAARREAARAREAQIALWSQESRLRSLIEHSLDGIALTDELGKVSEWNPAAESILGWSLDEACGRALNSLLGLGTVSDRPGVATSSSEPGPAVEPPPALDPLPRASRSSVPGFPDAFVLQLGSHAGTRKDGRAVSLELVVVNIPTATGTIQGAFFRDVSERLRLEQQVHQAQKLESVGQIAAGLAHEINTPVQYVSDSVCFVQDATHDLLGLITRLDALAHDGASGSAPGRLAAEADEAKQNADLAYLSEQVPRALERAKEGLQRVAELVRSMKEFAHPDQREMTSIDINRVVLSTLTVARNEYKYVADVDTQLADIPHVKCHGGEVAQVLLNLVVNAAHAIADIVADSDARGRIVVSTRRDGDTVVISVCDTGGGVPEAIAHRIFEPFFTTKEVGRGTGQGLAIAHGIIVRKHHGTLHFESEVGRGTTFFVRLPITQESTQEAAE